ncbi:hypothetical protein [Hirschia litorea]|uniref:Uncharacterized protein n=1 Tax=Hirschia litorea TaxID=1199156 RepID=A0ABW2ILG6_9PROT
MTVNKASFHLSRRLLLGGAGVSLLMPMPATARNLTRKNAPLLKLPASLVFLRLDENGAVAPSSLERRMWSQFTMNLGALVSRMEPIPHNNLIPGGQLETDLGLGSTILNARLAAQSQGYNYLVVYGVVPKNEGIKYKQKKKVVPSTSFIQNMRHKLAFWDWEYTDTPYIENRESHMDLMGEVHLLDLNGGAPLASAWAELPKRGLLTRWTSKDMRDEEIVQILVDGMQRKIQDLSMQNFEDQRSISQRF